MRLRTALNEYKRRRGGRFPEEFPTASGAFSAHGDRLVHVDPDGSLRDYSSPLSGLFGVDRSRFGVEAGGETRWFEQFETVRQHYYRETNLVETEYDADGFTVHQYDLTLGRAHLTHVELRGAIPADARLTAFLTLAPEGRESRVGRLVHEGAGPDGGAAVEVFHRREHDYVAASTGLSDVRGQIPERFDEMLSDRSFEFPREAVLQRYEDTHLSGDIVVTAPLQRSGRAARTTLVTQISDHEEVDRKTALADLRRCAETHRCADDVRAAARERTGFALPDGVPDADSIRADLRALSLLAAPTGARIAGPEFDPFYANSGGYGYAWFRDDASVSLRLLAAAESFDLDVDEELRRSARFYCDAQLDDGTWPHRVWASDGSLAPGWAHGRVEKSGREAMDASGKEVRDASGKEVGDASGTDAPVGRNDEYQADQTATVVTFLAQLLSERGDDLPRELRRRVAASVEAGVDGLDATLGDDGLPVHCQNLWEDTFGRFAHTAATFLEAYATVANAPVEDGLANRAASRARTVAGGLDDLWNENRGAFLLRLDGDALDDRLDSGTFALVDAYRAYAAVESLEADQLDRLCRHVETTLDGLWRDPEGSGVAGIVRYEGDEWRRNGQAGEKVWSVSTAWAAEAAALLGELCEYHGRDGAVYFERAADLYELVSPGGPLATPAGYLAEQVFDDGSHDGATPLGWSHALRLRTTALLSRNDALPTAASSPSGPESRPRWTTGEKYGVGTVADHDAENPSRVWFTLTEGALTELRFPRVDLMNLRTLDFLVVDADEDSTYTARTHNESRRDDNAETLSRRVEPAIDDALLFRHVVEERGNGRGREWTLTAEYAADPEHDAVLADVSFEAADDNEYEIYAVADCSLTNTGHEDRGIRLGRTGGYHLIARDSEAYDRHGEEYEDSLLVDQHGHVYSVAVAMAVPSRFEWATIGVAGGDRLDALFGEGRLPEARTRADDENVVLVGRLGSGSRLSETVGLGFGEHADTAAALGEVEGALSRGYERVRSAYVDSWASFLRERPVPDSAAGDQELEPVYKAALMVLRAVEDKTYRGAGIASPSVPWGEAVSADEFKGYGYNFVWARDLYQVFTAMEAVGDLDGATAALEYVYGYQQDESGFIPQNTYVDGRARWGGEQMDNISFPQVMADALRRRGIEFDEVGYSYENVRRSAEYVARNGPATAQERWEEEAGYSPSSIAAEIAGLACAAAVALDQGEEADALTWLALADDWAERVEEWTATESGTDLHANTPYYVRITRDGDPEAGNLRTLANDGPTLDEREIIDAGFLELVRLGIKPWDDEVVRNSLAEVDATIRVETPAGPAFYRYNGDGYGERGGDDEGGPWSSKTKGEGRLWPIFTGERGEYELLAGEEASDSPEDLLRTMARFANSGRMIPEQVWDREYATDYDWAFGQGTGSATPLAWSMAQYVRLAHSVDAGEPVETPPFVRERYLERDRPSGPDLRVDTYYEGDHVVVSGETDGALVAVRGPEETALVEAEGGEFAVRVYGGHGESKLTVSAATDADLEAAGTSVERLTL